MENLAACLSGNTGINIFSSPDDLHEALGRNGKFSEFQISGAYGFFLFMNPILQVFCQSQLLNLARTLRITGVELIMECLWSAEKFV